MRRQYPDQIRLLVRMLPIIARESVFALKGGTAINLFYRDMPRMSVDIDLTYLPVSGREESLRGIDEALGRIMAMIKERNPNIKVQRIARGGDNETQVMVRDGQIQVKIETSTVIRGSVYPAETMVVLDSVVDKFGFAEMKVLAFEDLYGGKICAALDRQHPRDLFDVKILYENEGLSDELFRVLMVYVASSNRPMHELLEPQYPLDEKVYKKEFTGMTHEPVTIEELKEARTRLHSDIKGRLSGDVAAFLLSLHDAKPDFSLIGLSQAADLPAVRWKIENLRKLKHNDLQKHAKQREKLEMLFQ